MSSKKIFIVSLLMTVAVGFFCFSNLALAEDYGLAKTAGAAGLSNTSPDIPTVVGNVLGTALSFIGVLFFALMVYGGFIWMTARGNEEDTKKALNTITAAVIGLIIVLSSYTITSFVFKSVGIQSGGSGSAVSGTVVSNPCTDFNSAFSCNEITSCDGIVTNGSLGEIKIENAANICNAQTPSVCKTGLCGSTNTKVCCKAKTESVNWCYVIADKVCKTQTDLGSAICAEGLDTVKYYEASTKEECYKKSLEGEKCSNNDDCAEGNSGYICFVSNCVPASSGSGNIGSACKNTSDCTDSICVSAGANANTCQKGTSASPVSLKSIAGKLDYCSGTQTDGDECTKSSQCADGVCAGGRCQTKALCSLCESDKDCNEATHFCNTNESTSGCVPKMENGESSHCFSTDINNNACKSGLCKTASPYNYCSAN